MEGGCCGIPFSMSLEAFIGKAQSDKSWGCGGKAPALRPTAAPNAGRPLIMRALEIGHTSMAATEGLTSEDQAAAGKQTPG